MVLLDTGTPGTSRQILSEDANGETRTPVNNCLNSSLNSFHMKIYHCSAVVDF